MYQAPSIRWHDQVETVGVIAGYSEGTNRKGRPIYPPIDRFYVDDEEFQWQSDRSPIAKPEVGAPAVITARGLSARSFHAKATPDYCSRTIESICGVLKWKAVQAPLICRGQWQDSFLDDCQELGMTLALGLQEGMF